jgi:hypothetical protein
MNSPQNPATSVVCFCDPSRRSSPTTPRPTTTTGPESLFATNQAWTTTGAGQTYMGELPARSRTATPARSTGRSGSARPRRRSRPSSWAASRPSRPPPRPACPCSR